MIATHEVLLTFDKMHDTHGLPFIVSHKLSHDCHSSPLSLL